MAEPPVHRRARPIDLPDINAVVESAVLGWSLPERVKRLALPSYCYDEFDMQHFRIEVASADGKGIIGVAAWENADPRDAPGGAHGLLLHGLYVHPSMQHRGIGGCLLDVAIDAARAGDCDGVLVKANPDANGFFERHGFMRAVAPESRYPHLFWLSLKAI